MVCAFVTLVVLASIGLPEGLMARRGGSAIGVLGAFNALLQCVVYPVAWVLGAVGLGRVVVGLARDGGTEARRHEGRRGNVDEFGQPTPPSQPTPSGRGSRAGPLARPLRLGGGASVWMQIPAGVGAMLLVSHLMGMAGLLSGDGRGALVWAWVPVAVGLVLLGDQLVRGPLRPEGWPVLPGGLFVGGPALGVVLVAVCSPPGWLWDSEYGAYDVMSYHLQLPKEWATDAPEGVGRLWPVEHNVYSFLPSYVEAAYLHLGAMMPAWPSMGTGVGVTGLGGVAERLVGGEGAWLVACQLLHGLLGVLASVVVGRVVYVVVRGAPEGGGALSGDDEEERARVARAMGVVAGALHLSVPWVQVCASLAYNEMAVNVLFAGAALVCVRPGVGAVARGALVGGLVGVACSAKPTALFMVAPTVGLMLLAFVPRKRWAGAIGAGAALGVLLMLPWLVRNWLACGNPVFPFAVGVFGGGHWSAEQVSTYAASHGPDVGWADRFGLLVSGARGLGHEQWAQGGVPIAGLIGVVVTLALVRGGDGAGARARAFAWALAGGAAVMVAAWLALTHLQSRFFLPLAVSASMGVGVGGWSLWRALFARERARGGGGGPRGGGARRAVVLGLGAAVVMLGVWSAVHFAGQRRNRPNVMLVAGSGATTGAGMEVLLADAPEGERRRIVAQSAAAEALVNLTLHPAMLGTSAFPGEGGVVGADGSREFGRVYLLGDGAPLYFFGATGGAEAGVVYHTAWDRSPLGDAIRAQPDEPAAWTAHLRGMGVEFVIVNFAELDRLITRSGYFDRAVTMERVGAWLADDGGRHGVRLLRTWPDVSLGVPPVRALYWLEGGGAAQAGEGVRR